MCVYVSVEAQIIDSFRIQTTSRDRVLKDFSCQGVGETVFSAAELTLRGKCLVVLCVVVVWLFSTVPDGPHRLTHLNQYCAINLGGS